MIDGVLEMFVPSIYAENLAGQVYAQMLVELERCAACQSVTYPGKRQGTHNYWFPEYFRCTEEAQAKRAGWKQRAFACTEDGKALCVGCAKGDASNFHCVLCKLSRKSSLAHDCFGLADVDTVCEPCYESTPAKIWDDFIASMRNKHFYDE